MSQDVAFRRIKGRIVPIRLNKEQKRRANEAAKGSAIAASGVAVAATSGSVYKKAVFKSATTAMKAFDAMGGVVGRVKPKSAQGSLFEFAEQAQKSEKAFKQFQSANRIASMGKVLKAASIPVGAGLITYGALKVLNAIPKEKKKKLDPALVAGGGAAAAFLAPKAFEYSKKAFEAGMHGRQGAFDFAKGQAASVYPKVKEAVIKIIKAKL